MASATWDDVLNEVGGIGDAPAVGRPDGSHDDGFLMASGVKNASKCRECSKTLDVGTPAWYNKDGEPGRKVTCQECHTLKVGDQPPVESSDSNGLLAKTIQKKPRKVVPKFTPELLLDKDKGITSVFRNFPKLKFKGKGHEAADLRRLVNKYAEWAHILVPNMEFSDFVEKLEKNSGNHRVRTKLESIRNVQQGLCDLDDIEDYSYELADKNAGTAEQRWEDAGLGEPDDWGETSAPASAPVVVSDEQRERMERNKRLALERAAARKAAAGGAPASGGAPETAAAPAAEEDEDMEAAWAEETGVGFDMGFDEFDEEAEADMFGDYEEHMAPPPAPAPAPAPAPTEATDADAPGAAEMEETLVDPAGRAALAAQRAREQAQAAAEALEAGLEDDEEF